jgi:hypothetical protein
MSVITFRTEHASIDTAVAPALGTAPHRGDISRFPSLTTTVPKELVHRAGVAEVLLTDWARLDDTHFVASAQWPRGHSFFTNVDGCHDPLIVAETIRQVGALLSHAEFGVPLGHHFLMWDLSVSVRPEHIAVDGTPAALDMEIVCSDVKQRCGKLTGFHYDVTIRRDGHIAATGSAGLTCTTPKVYERLRAERLNSGRSPIPLTSPTAPQNVGRTSPMDVVLSPTGEPDSWQLRVDTRHPVLFEHPGDHVPGMVLIEAARQATAAALGRSSLPLDVTSEFKRYAELDTPCLIEARRLPRASEDSTESVVVTGHQEGELVFWSTVTVAASPA